MLSFNHLLKNLLSLCNSACVLMIYVSFGHLRYKFHVLLSLSLLLLLLLLLLLFRENLLKCPENLF